MRPRTSPTRRLGRALRIALIALTLVTPLLRASSDGGAHCVQDGVAAMTGMDDGMNHPAPGDRHIINSNDCTHCPPADCNTTTPCSGLAHSVALGSTGTTWPSPATTGCTVRATSLSIVSTGFPPPTPPPQG